MDIRISTSAAELEQELGAAIAARKELVAAHRAAERTLEPFNRFGGIETADIKRVRNQADEYKRQIDKQDLQIEDLKRRLSDRRADEHDSEREVRDFWFRRFMLSLQIGNGAAFLATVAGVLQAEKEVLSAIAVLAWAPAIYFGLGVTAAGLLPLLMAARRSFPTVPLAAKAAYVAVLFMTTMSMGLFVLGVGSVMVELTQLRQPALEAASQVSGPGREAASVPRTAAGEGRTRGSDAGDRPPAVGLGGQQGTAAAVFDTRVTTPPAATNPTPAEGAAAQARSPTSVTQAPVRELTRP